MFVPVKYVIICNLNDLIGEGPQEREGVRRRVLDRRGEPGYRLLCEGETLGGTIGNEGRQPQEYERANSAANHARGQHSQQPESSQRPEISCPHVRSAHDSAPKATHSIC